MEFREAFNHMRDGRKVKLPNWKGYWEIDNNTIMIHLSTGEVIDIRQTEDTIFTFMNVISDKWELVPEPLTNLGQTIVPMMSDDYKKRFKAEYYQVLIRYNKLVEMLDKWDEGKLDFTPTCPRGIYDVQERAMMDYISVLEARAEIEGIEL